MRTRMQQLARATFLILVALCSAHADSQGHEVIFGFDENTQIRVYNALRAVSPNCSCYSNSSFYPNCLPSASVNEKDLPCVPKILHQTWNTKNVPESLRWFGKTWEKHNPNWVFLLWDEDSRLVWLKQHYSWFVPTYSSYAHPVQRSDAFRYFVLAKYGGVYVDLDFECLRPLDDFVDRLTKPVGFIGPGRWWSSISNSLIVSRVCPHLWADIQDRLIPASRSAMTGFWSLFPSSRIMSSTGPTLIRRWLEDERPTTVCRLHRDNFTPCDYCDDPCPARGPEVYTFHYHVRSWNRLDIYFVNNARCFIMGYKAYVFLLVPTLILLFRCSRTARLHAKKIVCISFSGLYVIQAVYRL